MSKVANKPVELSVDIKFNVIRSQLFREHQIVIESPKREDKKNL